MKTSKRFDNAVTKLYNAFHNGSLNAMDCKHCAVGNICDNNSEWFGFSGQGIYDGVFSINSNNENQYPIIPDYSVKELKHIEYVFLLEWSKERSIAGDDKKIQFKGLCAVVEYLCELDNIPNVMDYTSLFEYDDLGATKGIEILIEV